MGLTQESDARSGKPVPFDDLMASEAYRNVVLGYVDQGKKSLVFLEVSSLEELWAEPFEDRGVPSVATGAGFQVDFETAHEWARGQRIEAGRRLAFVWNTGRCGSTLMHRALCAAGAASLSEPLWERQYGHDPADEAAVDLAFTCHVVSWAVALRLFPSATLLAFNPKATGFHSLEVCRKAFPLERFDVRFVQMHRDARDVVESFGSIQSNADQGKGKSKDKGKPKGKGKSKGKPMVSMALAAKAPGELNMSMAPANDLARDISLLWSDNFLKWEEIAQEAPLEGRVLSVAFDEFTTKDPESRRGVLRACFQFLGLGDELIPQALEAFKENSQKGSAMEQSSRVTGKKFLEAADREAVATFVEHLTGRLPDTAWACGIGKPQ